MNSLMRWIDTSDPDGCWPWMRSLTAQGYGQCVVNGRTARAHREVYKLYNGPITKDVVVRHTCDNRACCNPKHLIAGTQRDNMSDKVERNRQQKGTSVPNSKLDDDKVRAIRADKRSSVEIAKAYGVGYTTIWCILTNKTWKHVDSHKQPD